MARCRHAFLLLASILAFASLACRSNDLVENELRARDIQYREALEELGRAESRNTALLRETEALRSGARTSPEQAAQSFGLKRIVLGRGTGGQDDDGLPGDEALRVVLEPRDLDDHTIKAPGTLHITPVEIDSQGIKTPLCTWTIEPDKLRQSWRQGLLSTGYNLALAWKNFPQTENLRVVARLVTSDGRVYETDKDIKVRLVPGAPHRDEAPPLQFMPSTRTHDPLALPAGYSKQAGVSARPSQSDWQPTPLEGVIQLGRPVR